MIGGIGLATLAVGAAFGVGAIINDSDAKKCSPCVRGTADASASNQSTDRAFVFANISNVTVPLGALGTLVGAYLVLSCRPEPEGGGPPGDVRAWRRAVDERTMVNDEAQARVRARARRDGAGLPNRGGHRARRQGGPSARRSRGPTCSSRTRQSPTPATTCAPRRARARTMRRTTASPDIYLALREVELLPAAGSSLGFDLNQSCTCDERPGTKFDGGASCVSSRARVCDADGGVDNQAAASLAVYSSFLNLDKAANINGRIADGQQTSILLLKSYNGTRERQRRAVRHLHLETDMTDGPSCPGSTTDANGISTTGWCGEDKWTA